MFTKLELQNFKSWKSAKVGFGRITGLFGENSSGKTSLIQFLLLLKQTMVDPDRMGSLSFNGPYIRLGTVSDAIFRHDTSSPLFYHVSLLLPEMLSLFDHSSKDKEPFEISDHLSLSAGTRIEDHAPVGYMLKYGLGNSCFSLRENTNGGSGFKLDNNRKSDFKFIRNRGRGWLLPGPLKSYQFPDQAKSYFQNSGFLSDLEYAFGNQLNNLYYLGPLRQEPSRDYLWSGSMPDGVGKRGERTIDALIASKEAGIRINLKKGGKLLPFTNVISRRMQDMGLLHDFRITEIAKGSNRWQARVKTLEGGSEVLLPDVGFGISQVLPVVTLLHYAPEGSTVIFEQPELHLHPLAQAELAEIVVAAATHRNVQVVFESHSEHFLLRLQRRIAEEELSSDLVRLYFCKSSDSGSVLLELQLDDYGNITNWPKGFMGDAFGETSEATLARIRRNKEN